MINRGVMNDGNVNGYIAADEEAYQLWLRNPNANVGHIVLMSYKSGTDYTAPTYIAKLSDFYIASGGYRDVIKSPPALTRQINDGTLSGEVAASLGDLLLDNADGALDLWPMLVIDGMPMRTLQGDPAWNIDRFRILSDCLGEACIGTDDTTMSVRVRGIEHGANLPIQTTLIPAAVGTTAQANQVWPKTYGKVFNASPVCIDEPSQVYVWNDAAVTSVSQVRDSGYPYQTNPIAISSVNSTTNVISTATAHGFFKDTRVRCDVGTLPSAASWSIIAWNGEVFCTVGFASAKAATSPDGIIWTQRTMPASRNWSAIAWNGLYFVALVNGDKTIAWSPDGITWTEVANAMPTADAWGDLCWDGKKFIAISSFGATANSTDGWFWTQHSMPASADWSHIHANGSIVVAIAKGTNGAAYSTTHGDSWVASTMPASAGWRALTYGNGQFYAIGGASVSETVAAYSLDGITWASRTVPNNVYWDIAWNGSLFCAITGSSGNTAYTSPDGITWSTTTLPATSVWIAIAFNGYRLCIVAASSANATTSADGSTWTGVSNSLPAPLAANTDYWVIADSLTNTAFKVSATKGGTEVDLTATTSGGVLTGYHWTVDLATSKLYLDGRPAGVLTMDGIAGSTVAATILPTVLAATNVDPVSQSRFAQKCPQAVGIYIKDRQNRLDIAQRIMSSLNAWYGYSRQGMLLMGRAEGFSGLVFGDCQYAITQDDMIEGSFGIERMILPMTMVRLGYRTNWTNQNGALVAGVSAEARAMFSADYSVTLADPMSNNEGPNGETLHPLAVMPEPVPTLMYGAYDAWWEGIRLAKIFSYWGAILRCTVGRIGSEMNPGDVVKLVHPRYYCNQGVPCVLTYVEDQPATQTTALRFFAGSSDAPGRLALYSPGQL